MHLAHRAQLIAFVVLGDTLSLLSAVGGAAVIAGLIAVCTAESWHTAPLQAEAMDEQLYLDASLLREHDSTTCRAVQGGVADIAG